MVHLMLYPRNFLQPLMRMDFGNRWREFPVAVKWPHAAGEAEQCGAWDRRGLWVWDWGHFQAGFWLPQEDLTWVDGGCASR